MEKTPTPEAVVLDTETTGLKGEIIEIGLVSLTNQGFIAGNIKGSLFKPKGSIEYGAMAVHNITHEMVELYPSYDEIKDQYLPHKGCKYVIGHNLSFDLKFVDPEFSNYKHICTLDLAKKLGMKEHVDSLKNLALYYYFKGNLNFIPAGEPHRATYDAQITAFVLYSLMQYGKMQTLDDVYQFMNDIPDEQFICGFPKHKGKKWEQVIKDDRQYVQWVCDSNILKKQAEHVKLCEMLGY